VIDLLHGDCLELMKTIPDNSVDMCLTDPPYGTTACKWDNVIPFEPMWAELKRIVKDNGAICLFGQQPFFSQLICSNIDMFKSEWIFEKAQAPGGFHAKKKVMKKHENIAVFYKNQPAYNPVMELKTPEQIRRSGSVHYVKRLDGEYEKRERKNPKNPYKYPSSVQYFNKEI
jgi:site-specific DNA-methyltransferase (adenine-specific)